MDEINERLKAFFEKSNIPLFGVASAHSLENQPPGYRPSDLIDSSKSIICMGLPIPKGVFLCEKNSEQIYWRTVNVYYRNIDAILLKASNLLEEKGGVAVPIYGCYPFDIKGRGDLWGYISLVHMAEAAGLGKMAKNCLLFNSTFGPRLLLGGIITSLALPPVTWPEKDEKGCPEECTVCRDACPVGAFEKDGKVDRLACVGHSMKSPLFSYLMGLSKYKTEDVQVINHSTAVDDHSWYSCIKCVSACPYI